MSAEDELVEVLREIDRDVAVAAAQPASPLCAEIELGAGAQTMIFSILRRHGVQMKPKPRSRYGAMMVFGSKALVEDVLKAALAKFQPAFIKYLEATGERLLTRAIGEASNSPKES